MTLVAEPPFQSLPKIGVRLRFLFLGEVEPIQNA
jgi:hypothetical protein